MSIKNGFLIQNDKGEYVNLTDPSSLERISSDKLKEMYDLDEHIIYGSTNVIKIISMPWPPDIKPTRITPATYDESIDAIMYNPSDSHDINNMSLDALMKLLEAK